jgi:two-component system CheB/CheR fusion protein
LQAKVDELSRAANDMKNLLDSTDIAILFLDAALNVRRFTTKTSQIIKLIPGDMGRPITDIASNMVYPGLADDAQEVLRTLISIQKPVAASDDRWFLVRIIPYRTLDNRIDGVVITFTDVTASKKLEAELRITQSAMENRIGEKRFQTQKHGQDKPVTGATRSRRKKREIP